MTSRERVAKHRKAKRDAGLVPLPETWVPAELLVQVLAAIERVVKVEDARRAHAMKEAAKAAGRT